MSNKVPQIRFNGYSDAWVQRNLGEWSDVRDGTHASPKYIEQGHPMVTSKNLTDSGLDMSDVSYLTDEDFNEINKRSKVDIGDILFGMIGTIGNPVIVDRDDFAIKNVALIKEQSSPEIINTWLIQYLKSPSFERFIQKKNTGGTQKFIALGLIRDMKLMTPSVQEQARIGELLTHLDKLIAANQRKLDLLKEQKKGYLQKMFPKNGKKVPELRFAGFADDWEERKFGDEFKKVNERNNGSFGREHWISVANMYFQDPEKVQSNNIDTHTYVMRIGDMAFEGNKSSKFKYGRFVVNDIGNGVVSELFPIYRHNNEYDNSYWKNAIQIERIMAPIFAKAITSSGVSSNKLDNNHFLNQKICIPPLKEQQKIGSFFKQLDNTIALHQRKLDLLKEQKKGFLQKMFV